MSRSPSKKALTVCFIEHNPLALEYLLSMVRKDPSIEVEAMEGGGVRSRKESPSRLFIIDSGGLPLPLSECLMRLWPEYPDARYLVLSHELARRDLLRLLGFKIDGFLSYREVPRSLLAALHSIAGGNIWVPREVLREYVHGARQARQKNSPFTDRMTAREIQISELIERRFSNKEVADILRIQESTVKFHLSNIYSKLQVGGRHGLIRERQGPVALQTLLPSFARSAAKS